MFWNIIGSTAAVLTMFSFVPQIVKIIKNKSANDISLVTLIQFCAGLTLWLAYGIHLRNFIIITANSVSLTSILVVFYLYLRYKTLPTS